MAFEKRIHDLSENNKIDQSTGIESKDNESPSLQLKDDQKESKNKTDQSEADKESINQSEVDKEIIDQSEAVKSRPRRRSICVSSLFSINKTVKGGCFPTLFCMDIKRKGPFT